MPGRGNDSFRGASMTGTGRQKSLRQRSPTERKRCGAAEGRCMNRAHEPKGSPSGMIPE